MSYPLDRMRGKLWRMAENESEFEVYVVPNAPLFGVRKARSLWDWSWWNLDTFERLK